MTPIISVANLSKTYSTGFRALNNINLDIRRGEIFALLGPNGAGKTTLFRTLLGLQPALAGQVAIDGVPLEFLRPAAAANAAPVPSTDEDRQIDTVLL